MSNFINITEDQKDEYNKVVDHPLQSYEWGEFRKKTGIKIVRKGLLKNGKLVDNFTLTIHKIPYTSYTIGYLPKEKLLTKELLEELHLIGKQENCAYIQLEPNIQKISNFRFQISDLGLRPSFHPLFTKYTFILDLTKSEDELLKNMNSKTRYNIKVAKKHGVWIEEDNSEKGLNEYLKLTSETTKRQHFYAHTLSYHKKLWEVLAKNNDKNTLNYHLFHAKYKNEEGKTYTLVSWVLFVFHDTLYYPYGASSSLFRNTMASNLMMWEAIKFGKKLNLKKFDMWGALGTDPDKNDSWYGFHKFKQGYGGVLTEFVGSYDLVINPFVYHALKVTDKLRWTILKLKKQ